LLLAGLGTAAAAPALALDGDTAEVRTTLAAFVEAMNALDAERFALFFAEDATSFFPGAPHPARRVTGRAAIMAEFRGLFDHVRSQGRRLSVSPQDLEIRRAGELAVATFHLGTPEKPQRRTMILQRRGGDWLIVHLHASGHPGDAPKPKT
jgi:uncharacterized protein (TIGR02246 family)